MCCDAVQWCASDGGQTCPTGTLTVMTVGKLVSDQNIIGGVSDQKSPWSNRFGPNTPRTCYAAAGTWIIQTAKGAEMCLGAYCDTSNVFGGSLGAAACNVAIQLQFRCGQYQCPGAVEKARICICACRLQSCFVLLTYPRLRILRVIVAPTSRRVASTHAGQCGTGRMVAMERLLLCLWWRHPNTLVHRSCT